MLAKRHLPVAAIAAAGFLAFGCGDSSGPEGLGNANILLVAEAASASLQGVPPRLSVAGDVPMAAVEAIEISLTRIEVHRTGSGDQEGAEEGGESGGGGGWVALNLEAAAATDLLQLSTTGGVPIASGGLEPGTYNQVRLFFSDAMIRLSSDVTVQGGQVVGVGAYEIRIPSAEQTGLKIPTSFEVPEGGETTVVLEVGVNATVGTLVWNANGFQMSPVMKER